jgi:hypothetical protein
MLHALSDANAEDVARLLQETVSAHEGTAPLPVAFSAAAR